MNLSATLEKLSVNTRREEQEWAISALAEALGEPRLVVMPGTADHWYNAARVIKLMGRPRIDPVLPELLEWLRDVKNPGYEIIFELLSSQLPRRNLADLVEHTVRFALDVGEMRWIKNLASLSHQAELEISDFRWKDAWKVMEILYEN